MRRRLARFSAQRSARSARTTDHGSAALLGLLPDDLLEKIDQSQRCRLVLRSETRVADDVGEPHGGKLASRRLYRLSHYEIGGRDAGKSTYRSPPGRPRLNRHTQYRQSALAILNIPGSVETRPP